MNARVGVRPRHVISLVLIGIIAVACLWALSVLLRGFVVALLVTVGVVVVLAAIQYFLWGYEFSSQPAVRRAEAEVDAGREAARRARQEPLPLYLSDQERSELVRLLEDSLHEAHLGAAEGPSPRYQESSRREEAVLRGLLEKVREYNG